MWQSYGAPASRALYVIGRNRAKACSLLRRSAERARMKRYLGPH